jgi:hypothetical protein
MNTHFEKYRRSWTSRSSSMIADNLVFIVRILFAIVYFVVMVLLSGRMLPPPTHATLNVGYDLVSILIRVLFLALYFVVDWILFVKTQKH